MKKGLCFSGGGIKAFAHIGALKALEENNIKFDMVSGTSSGSIIAILYGLGYSSDEMYKILKKYTNKLKYVDLKNVLKFIFGLNSGNVLTKAMKDICKKENINLLNEIKMPIAIPAVNLKNGEVIMFSSKEVRKEISDNIKYITDVPIDVAVRSSSSYPVVYSPYKYKNLQLVDGGIRENVAWKELKNIGAERILCINFESYIEENSFCDNMIDIAMRSLNLMEHELANYELEGIEDIITITTGKVRFIRYKQNRLFIQKRLL